MGGFSCATSWGQTTDVLCQGTLSSVTCTGITIHAHLKQLVLSKMVNGASFGVVCSLQTGVHILIPDAMSRSYLNAQVSK